MAPSSLRLASTQLIKGLRHSEPGSEGGTHIASRTSGLISDLKSKRYFGDLRPYTHYAIIRKAPDALQNIERAKSTKVRFAGLHLKTTASCAILFRDVTAMLMKPVMGHSLRELAKFRIPLVGSVRR